MTAAAFDFICDLDNTVTDASHRQHLVTNRPKNFKAFNLLAAKDPAIEPVCIAVRALRLAKGRCLFTSGREGTHQNRQIAVDWLLEAGLSTVIPDVPDTHLFMRPAKDYRADDIVKEMLLRDHILAAGFCPIFALDDRDRVVAMWRRNGIPCFQVKEGNF
jgi:hypothetical protein